MNCKVCNSELYKGNCYTCGYTSRPLEKSQLKSIVRPCKEMVFNIKDNKTIEIMYRDNK